MEVFPALFWSQMTVEKLSDHDEKKLYPSPNHYKPIPGLIPPRANNYQKSVNSFVFQLLGLL